MTELDILNRLREQPAMFLGRKSLTALNGFVSGYVSACADQGVTVSQDINTAMQDFVRKWYKVTPNFHWSRILLMVCNTEDAAFERFFEMLDLYLKGVDPETRELCQDEGGLG